MPESDTNKQFVDALDGLTRVYAGRSDDCIRLTVDEVKRIVAIARDGLIRRNEHEF